MQALLRMLFVFMVLMVTVTSVYTEEEMTTTASTEATTTPYCVKDCMVDENCTQPEVCVIEGCNMTCAISAVNFTSDASCPVEVGDTSYECVKQCDDNTDCSGDNKLCCEVSCGTGDDMKTKRCLSAATELKSLGVLLIASLLLHLTLR